jgi:hypothetical protein
LLILEDKAALVSSPLSGASKITIELPMKAPIKAPKTNLLNLFI